MNKLKNWPEPMQLVTMPQGYLQELSNKVDLVLDFVMKTSAPSLGDWITEPEARNLLGKGKTWFYTMRTTGQLPYRKVGGTVYYKRSQITKLIEEGSNGKS